MNGLSLAFKIAWRDLRGSLAGLRVLVVGIALGVAAVAAVGSVAGAVLDGMRGQARLAIGGDVSVRLFHVPPRPEHRDFLRAAGTYGETAELRPAVRRADGAGRPVLVELKAVDDAYPLYGTLGLEPQMPVMDALGRRGGAWGAAVDRSLLDALGMAPGDRLRLGVTVVEIRAVIQAEPERALRTFALGPRVIVARGALDASGLAAPGAQVYWYGRVRLPPPADASAFAAALEQHFPDAGWRIVDAGDGVPGMERTVRIARALLVLVAAAVLLIGGVGVAHAVAGHIECKVPTIAILKGLGASGRLLFAIYLAQVAAAAALAVAIGLAIGAAAPLALRHFGPDWLLGPGAPVVQPAALALAAALGLLTTALFALWPLGRVGRMTVGELFRDTVAPSRARPGPGVAAAMLAVAAAMAVLLLAGTGLPLLAGVFCAAAGCAVLLFLGLGKAVSLAAGRVRGVRRPLLRLALGNLSRPGAATTSMVMALGLGLTALVAVLTVHGNARLHLAGTLPRHAPDLVFIDVPPERGAAAEALVAGIAGVERVRRMPFLQARLTHVRGEPLLRDQVPRDVAWAVRGDRGLSWAAAPPAGTRIVEGEWWDEAHAGPPLASLAADVARRLGIGIGDRLTFNVLGRPVEVEVANLRAVDWTTLGLDVPVLLSPPPDPPPHAEILAVQAAPGALDAVEAAMREMLPRSPAVRVAPLIGTLSAMVEGAGRALSLASGATVVAALVVVAGGAAASYRRRRREMAMLRVLGARPRQLALAGAIEFGLLGAAAAGPAVLLGTAAAYAVVRGLGPDHWMFLPAVPALLALGTVAASTVAGMVLARCGGFTLAFRE
ncbi:ABC transporter permease [Arenibaculum sp.]|uniref:ABC transporter permease n=1 Tax=Arenibaculum sp. TaxID=2865862 RepID=UPI002E1328E2|nr:ABC transporter permease [Arenibaculum sp.]